MAAYDEVLRAASKIASSIAADVLLYNGPIVRGLDRVFIEKIAAKLSKKQVLLLLVAGGGDPDAAYKLSRLLQDRYEKFTILVSGFCKSAGTLIALGAHELAFTSFGELGPLDIQLGKVDKFDAPQSGLAIQEALDTLESRARRAYDHIVNEYMIENGGLLSFAAATKSASDFVTELYAPIFARIDPEEVGSRSRSMRIAHEYGRRLALRSQNLKQDTLTTLAEKYPSHSFVIDQREAATMFQCVRAATSQEESLVAALGNFACFPRSSASDRVLEVLSDTATVTQEGNRAKANVRGGNGRDGAHPARNAGTAEPVARRPGKVSPRSIQRSRSNGKVGVT